MLRPRLPASRARRCIRVAARKGDSTGETARVEASDRLPRDSTCARAAQWSVEIEPQMSSRKNPVSARRVCAQQVYGLRRVCAPQQVCGLRRVCARQQPSSPRSPRHSRPKSLQAPRRDHWPGSKRLRTREREPCHKTCRQQHRVFRFHYSFLLFEDCASKIRFEGRMMNGPFGQLERVAHLSHA
jgi:hypothetical protein